MIFSNGGRFAEEVSPPYNILPIHDILSDHPSLKYPEVRAATKALLAVGDLRKPPFAPSPSPNFDLLDWLADFFGFQDSNVRNQREHLVLLLSNDQMRHQAHDPQSSIDELDSNVVTSLQKRLFGNYVSWCSFIRRTSNLWLSPPDPRRDLLYVGLYLLIWGESGNLRFMPECLCYIFHHMANELNRILGDYIDVNTGDSPLPAFHGENAFLLKVVTPIYDTLQKEVESSKNGTEPHSAWRNYDDINEYFWDSRCFDRLGWPMNLSGNFFYHDNSDIHPSERTRRRKKQVGKTGFVEQRSFWNLFRNFDRLWIMLILFLQAAIIVAFNRDDYPWQGLKDRDVQIRILSVFMTWSGLRFIQSILDAGTQYSLVSSETKLSGVRMVLKAVVALIWTVVFVFLYDRIWTQRDSDGEWSSAANQRVTPFLLAAFVFILPELSALVLLLVPWISNFVDKSNSRFASFLTWWFHSRVFVGRGLREGIVDTVMYGLYWTLVLSVKFIFSYFLQIKPMVKPTIAILDLTSEDMKYTWYRLFRDSNRFTVGVLWLPVILIYLMDISIWYAIFSSSVGALVGLLDHIGEIRNVQQLRLRFQFFASAMQFNMLPEDQLIDQTWGRNIIGRFNNMIQRLKLRYGLGRPYKKIHSNQVEPSRFALIWNEVIHSFREEDIISNREVELLELPPNAWGIRVIRWPCFLLGNELRLALSQVNNSASSSDKNIWRKLCKQEYRKCAVIEAYDSIKFLLLEIIKDNSLEHSIVSDILSGFDDSVHFEKLTVEFKMKIIPKIHSNIVDLLDALIKPKKDMGKVVSKLQSLFNTITYDFPNKTRNWPSNNGLLFENVVELPGVENANFYRQVRRLHSILSCSDSMSDVPKNLEARRRIAFFSNSLFMNMPRAPLVEKMLAFSVLTPYYEEEVVYTVKQLKDENEDGVSILYYLKTIHSDEWTNFLERMHDEGMVKDEELLDENKRLLYLRLWASNRGQTLTRTVRGMTYYYRALKMLAFLDSASEIDVGGGSRELAPMHMEDLNTSQGSRDISRNDSGMGELFKGQEYGIAQMKFTYVVACQLYGSQKKNNDSRAAEILLLMKKYEALRVAYVDEVNARGGNEYYSVLVKYDHDLDKEVEIYRIRLPGPLKLGEGKPENQNHALVFTRGVALQTIDMNQDNYFEEALKMRNLLEEFTRNYGTRKPNILGVREHIFTASVSSLAWFMSAQETSFVTLGQRVLAKPLKIRLHYGHPDVFDRIWFLSRGGVSKASKVINISEDIFAGFNCTLRGGNVTHHEYIQVGKGRDVGLNQISLFEAKVASGNGEQVSSRDVYRLGHRLDFFRMLSFYYTTVGFFFNTMLVVLTVYAFLWGRLYLAMSGIEASISGAASNNAALGSILNQQFIIQLGFFTALPMVVENSLELGFLRAVWDFIKMQLQLASVFYTFSMGTRTHYFGRTILHGGAKYQATGRGFVVEHKSFCENYRLYARSHFSKAIELGFILSLYSSYSPIAKDTFVYIALTISSWFLVVSWLMAPFIFNPSGFDWLKTVNDFEEFMNWIWYRGVFADSKPSWEKWWNEQFGHLRTTSIWGKILEIVLNLRFFFFQYGIVYHLRIGQESTSIFVYLLSWIFIIACLGVLVLIYHARDKYSEKEHIYYRAIQTFVILCTLLVIIILLVFTNFGISDIFICILAFIPTGWGLISIAQVIGTSIKLNSENVLWDVVVKMSRLYEIMFGLIVITPVAILSWAPGFQSMQTKILFNDAFSRGLEMSRILLGKKATSKSRYLRIFY